MYCDVVISVMGCIKGGPECEWGIEGIVGHWVVARGKGGSQDMGGVGGFGHD